MKEFVLDASFALCWCFEDEATAQTESTLTALQNQEAVAWVPAIWRYEMLNGLGKGVARGRLNRDRAFLFWQEIEALPIRIADVAVTDASNWRSVQFCGLRRELPELGAGARASSCHCGRETPAGRRGRRNASDHVIAARGRTRKEPPS